ncbi:hypothetical protein KC19_11G154300, partial [Ceratodon purpureus]
MRLAHITQSRRQKIAKMFTDTHTRNEHSEWDACRTPYLFDNIVKFIVTKRKQAATGRTGIHTTFKYCNCRFTTYNRQNYHRISPIICQRGEKKQKK